MTHAYAHAHFSNKRVIRELRIVSCPGGGVWVAVTREFERDNCVISEILQSDWTIPNRAGVPRKSTKVPRPSFRVWAGRSGHETRPTRGSARHSYAHAQYIHNASLGPRPTRDSRTKEGLGTLVDFLGTPARFGMVQSDCRISLITQLSRSNSRVTATQTPPPGHDTMRSSRITRLLLKCACA